jgi:hypothetical protein
MRSLLIFTSVGVEGRKEGGMEVVVVRRGGVSQSSNSSTVGLKGPSVDINMLVLGVVVVS